MTSYAFWNNKGGVGKSFLCFAAAAEYAHNHPESDVYVIDLCPQANVSEILLGGNPNSPKAMNTLLGKSPRATIAGYLEARLNSPFKTLSDVNPYISAPKQFNAEVPDNLYLICGDNLLEIIAEAIRQTSQLSIPTDAWRQVLSWVKDLVNALKARNPDKDTLVVIDCNPSFAIYTQLALAASEYVVVPFTADDSSRRGIENVVALLYGVGDPHTATYAKLSFSKKAMAEGLDIPKLHTFVSNRVTLYEGVPSKAFRAMSKTIKTSLDKIYQKHRGIFANPKNLPSKNFIDIPDYHSACIISSTTGKPVHKIKSGHHKIGDETMQLNPDPLKRYKDSLAALINCL